MTTTTKDDDGTTMDDDDDDDEDGMMMDDDDDDYVLSLSAVFVPCAALIVSINFIPIIGVAGCSSFCCFDPFDVDCVIVWDSQGSLLRTRS